MGAGFDIAALHSVDRQPQIFNQLFIEHHYQSHRASALCRNLTVSAAWIRQGYPPLLVELLLLPAGSKPLNRVVTAFRSDGYACKEAFTALNWAVNSVCWADNRVSKSLISVVRDCCWVVFSAMSAFKTPSVGSVRLVRSLLKALAKPVWDAF